MLKAWLNNKKLYPILLFLNFVIGIVIFLVFYKTPGKDAITYLGLADGILHGSYSYWNFLKHPIPDTLRNPGYPLFLAFFQFFTKKIFVIQLAQLILYFVSLRLALSILKMLYHKPVINNIFLILLLPSIYMASYAPVIFPEILVTFLILFILWYDLRSSESLAKYIFLGLLFGITFQVRPAIMFLPFIFVAYNFLMKRNDFRLRNQVLMVMVFLLTMVPYGLWNKKNHGVFKVTSLEGGGGLLHLGYWSFKMPDYYDTRYWGNYCNREMISFIDEKDRDENIKRYNAEWDIIDSICAPLITPNDSVMVAVHDTNHAFLKTFNSAYTLKREELLKEYAVKNIKNDLKFYTKTKIYSAIRLWVTGLRMKDYYEAGPLKKVSLLYPLFLTLVTFIIAIVLIPLAFYRYGQQLKKMLFILIVTVYLGFIHIPFTIQARYTIPVRLELLMLIAASAYFLLYRKESNSEA